MSEPRSLFAVSSSPSLTVTASASKNSSFRYRGCVKDLKREPVVDVLSRSGCAQLLSLKVVPEVGEEAQQRYGSALMQQLKLNTKTVARRCGEEGVGAVARIKAADLKVVPKPSVRGDGVVVQR